MNNFARIVKCRSLTLLNKSKYLCNFPGRTLPKTLCYTMSQKSILFFFKSAEQTKVKDTNSNCITEDSPVKKFNKKRKVQCIESDDESSLTPTKKLNGECSNSSEFCSDNKRKPSDKICGNEEEGIVRNGDASTGKQNGIKNQKETNTSHSLIKSNSKCKEDSHVVKNGSIDIPAETDEKPSTSFDNDAVIIPKRKTARKQISSGRNLDKTYAKQIKTASEFENTNKAVGDKYVLNSTEVEKNEDKKCEAKEESSKTLSESEETSEKDEKLADVKQPKNQPKIYASKKAKDSPLKKSVKKESIHSFFTSVKDAKNENRIETKSEKSCLSIENDDCTAKEEKKKDNSNEQEKDLVENDDSPVKKVQKKKIQCLESDEEDNPVKKVTKQIKVENNSCKKAKRQVKTADTPVKKTKEQIKNKDSPVKKGQKKKTQCLKSEDEDDKSASVELSLKKETSGTEIKNVSDSSKERKDSSDKEQESSNEKVPEAKNSSSTASSDSSSKVDKDKKFGVKSTSAVDTIYNPGKNNYHPIDDAFWKHKEKVPYLALAKTLELIENTSGRLKTIEILANFFRSVIVLSPDDFLHCVYLCLNRVAPEYEGIEMGIGETLLMKAVAQATGRTVDKIKAEVAVKGDLGLVSESSRGNQRVMFAPPKLTVSAVFNKFLEIAKMSGNAAMAKKIDKIKGLFVACRDCEAKYIIRSLSGKLRIGLAEQSVLSAIARAAILTPPDQAYPPKKVDASHGISHSKFKEFLDSQTLILKTAYCECPNYDLVIPVLLKGGISALPEHCQLSPGVPLKPMLAHPTAGIDIVLTRFDKNAFTCEFKYDGERAQIHMTDKGIIKIFSRNQEDNTSKYPDIISLFPKVIKESTKSFILDSEAVAYDREKKQILPFQVLSTRKKKDVVESEITVQVCVVAFDLLYLNGESLVKKPLKERRNLLHSSFSETENKFMFAQYRDGDNAETMQEFLDESVKGNCEGLMVKALEVDASYEIAKRSHNWLKLKKDYLQGVGDTIDLVVIGGYYGKGKRTGNYGGFLLACYDSENEEFQSICKLGTGFKDDILEAHTKFLKQHVIKEPKKYYSYDSSLEPDEWFEPVQVWEIKCADLSVSPIHRAAIGIVDPKKGISLRFPRFIRIREDKSVEDATNSSQVADMYRNQQQIQNTSNTNSNVEEDYY